MNINLQKQYEFMRWRQRTLLHYKEIQLRESLARASKAILQVRSYIAQGCDPRITPEIKDIYYYLINEFGDQLFESEMMQFNLHKEEDKEKDKTLQ